MMKGSNRRTCRNGAYHWVLEDGIPTDGKILTYGLAFALLAYSKVLIIFPTSSNTKFCKIKIMLRRS